MYDNLLLFTPLLNLIFLFQAYNCLDETTNCFDILSTYNTRVLVVLSLVFWFLYYFLWGTLYLHVFRFGTINKTLIVELIICIGILTYISLFPCKKLSLKRWLIINISITGTITSCITQYHEVRSV